MDRRPLIVLITLIWGLGTGCTSDPVLYSSPEFTVRASRVTEREFEAIAWSSTELRSSYESAFRRGIVGPVVFKFAINGRDNERAPMLDHRLAVPEMDSLTVAPVILFGEAHPTDSVSESRSRITPFRVRFRVDLAPVFQAFQDRGYFQGADGTRIRRADFQGVQVVGSADPLTWDFASLADRDDLRLRDEDGDRVYEGEVLFNASPSRALQDGYGIWRQDPESVGSYPDYLAPEPMLSALYNLSIEELQQSIRPDGTFMAGAEWPGVWTRDIAYAAVLSLAFLSPEVTRRSLLAKTARGRIVQDTGTGGAWPVSSDRMTWALAAWEVFATTGDRDWLREAYEIIRRSAADDQLVVQDPATGLYRGESSFLDWREQSYPAWMDPRDIYHSINLGTNVVHAGSRQVLAKMALELGEDPEPYVTEAAHLSNAINYWLWVAERGYYGQFRYGRRAPVLSPRSETLGEALSILYGIASPDRARSVAARTPVLPYGSPSFHPQIAGIPPYHNDGIWPFVVGFWTWAGAEAGNNGVVEHGLASIYRASALFLTNKENMVGSTGRYDGTEINSDRQLWSVAANLATVYRVLFGMRFEADRLRFAPFVPEPYRGTRVLREVKYRNAVLHIEMSGHGGRISSFELDGAVQEDASVPGTLQGLHHIRIQLDDQPVGGAARVVANASSPSAPRVALFSDTLRWTRVLEATAYVVSPGDHVTSDTLFVWPPGDLPDEMQVRAVSAAGYSSFRSEPIRRSVVGIPITFPPAAGRVRNGIGFTEPGFVRLDRARRPSASFRINVPEEGSYVLWVRYANGNGPINTDNRAAIRTVRIDGRRAGVMVMPQRGQDVWDDWGESSSIHADLTAGNHSVELVFTSDSENMNGAVNAAWVDALYLDRR